MYCDRLQHYCNVLEQSLKHAKIGYAGLAALAGLNDSMHPEQIELTSDEENLNGGGYCCVNS